MTRLISFEGGDGSGKTTQLKLLESYLVARGEACLCTREPGGTTLGEMIRRFLLEVGVKEISSPTELFLYLADRAQHVQEVIQPTLKPRKIVLCDRFTQTVEKGLSASLCLVASQSRRREGRGISQQSRQLGFPSRAVV